MRQLKGCVQVAADADITHAQAIIEGAGMYVASSPTRPKQDLAARYGGSPGQVNLAARALVGQGSYQWQMLGTDHQTWIDLPPTVVASTSVLVSRP